MSSVSEHLRRLRQSKGLSIRALSHEVGISNHTLGAYELGRIGPSLENAYRIAQFFGVPLEYLVSGSKVYADFNDGKLLALFRTVDAMDSEDRALAKRYLQKLVRNRRERRELNEEVD